MRVFRDQRSQTHAETQINNDHEFPEAGQQQISGRRDPVCF